MTRNLLVFLFIFTGLTGCASKKPATQAQAGGRYHLQNDAAPHAKHVPNLAKVKDAVPKSEPKSKYGNPKSYVVFNKRYQVMDSSKDYKQKGFASWYGKKFHGYRTSSGEPYDMFQMTAAHKSLPLPTYAWVTNLGNGKRVIVKINDRGPFHDDRIIDLSYAAATKLDMLGKGTAKVEVEAIDPVAFANRSPKFGQQHNKPIFARHEPTDLEAKKEKRSVVYAAVKAADLVGSHYLQVGAFRDQDNARTLTKKLKEILDLPIHIKETEREQQRLYTVRVGPFEELEHLSSAHEILANAEYTPIRVREEI